MTAPTKTNSPGCPLGHENRAHVTTLRENDVRQWDAIDRLRNRLPTWATLAIASLTGLTCSLITYITTHPQK